MSPAEYFNQSNLGRVVKALVTYYNEEKEEPFTDEIEWVEGVNIINSKLLISHRIEGHAMREVEYDIKTVRNLVLI